MGVICNVLRRDDAAELRLTQQGSFVKAVFAIIGTSVNSSIVTRGGIVISIHFLFSS